MADVKNLEELVLKGEMTITEFACAKIDGSIERMKEKHPEMQIIGPAPEKFLRRREYGVGKYFDSTIRI